MKRLVLVRHGKSSWKYDLPDEERPLKKRGYRDGKLVTDFFLEFYKAPAVLWSSPAVRAHETAKIFKKKLQVPDDAFMIKDELYTFEAAQLLKTIRTCDDEVQQLIVFGHNPAMTNVANRIGTRNYDNVPTTGLVVIDFKVERWEDIKNGKTILDLFPKNIR